MKKILLATLVVVMVISIAACKTDDPSETNDSPDTVNVEGRIIEIVEGTHIIIRNEVDTSIYHKLNISDELTFKDGVNENLNPDNVISADVKMLDPDALPKETELITITANKAPNYRIIDAKQAKAMIDEGGVLIVDVRTRVEYESGYIPDAYNVELDQIEKGIGNVTENKDDKILVYCRSGNRSKVAARILTEMGYTNVYDFGGIVDWPFEVIVP